VSAVDPVAVATPLVPVTTIVPLPAAAVADGLTVTVAVLPAFKVAGLKLTVTPVGAVAARVMLLVNPLVAPTATV
jgi:hypothetical protein